jgi:hypothetical protein
LGETKEDYDNARSNELQAMVEVERERVHLRKKIEGREVVFVESVSHSLISDCAVSIAMLNFHIQMSRQIP